MAEIVPFRGVLYNPAKVGEIAQVVAPPYDVIGPAEQAALHARHPYNVIRLELGQEHQEDTPQNNRYTRARGCLDEWLREGILRRDDQPALYLYAIAYRLRSGQERTLRGFLSLVTLEEFDSGGIFPHENTRAAAKSDRYQLLEACRSNFSPIYSLYADPEGRVIRHLEKAVDEGTPRLDVVDGDGVRHRLWTVDDPAVLAEVAALMKPHPLFIADGHHRYESALRYRNAQREAQGPGGRLPSDLVLMYCSNLDDPGLTILPTHRLIPPPAPCSSTELRQGLTGAFTIKTFPFTKDTEPETRKRFLAALQAAQATSEHVMGLVARGELRYDLLTLNEQGLARLGSSTRERLDVSILQQLVLREAMRMTPQDEDRILYLKDEDETLAAVSGGEGELAFLLNPPKINEVKNVARAGDRMPHKSTYFSPKPLTGFVINTME
jgi:uncharacterized protein (DUF1015 family)